MLNLRKAFLFSLALSAAVLTCGCGHDTLPSLSESSQESSEIVYTNEIVYTLPENNAELLGETADVIEERIHLLGLSGYNIAQDSENSTITVGLEIIEEEASEVIEKLSAPNRLTFRRGDDTAEDSESGEAVPTGEILLSGSDVASAYAAQTTMDWVIYDYVVTINFTEEGAEKFAEVTRELAMTDVPLSIWMDNTLLLAPTVNDVIIAGEAVITGFDTIDEAYEIADKISMGELPDGTEVVSD